MTTLFSHSIFCSRCVLWMFGFVLTLVMLFIFKAYTANILKNIVLGMYRMSFFDIRKFCWGFFIKALNVWHHSLLCEKEDEFLVCYKVGFFVCFFPNLLSQLTPLKAVWYAWYPHVCWYRIHVIVRNKS